MNRPHIEYHASSKQVTGQAELRYAIVMPVENCFRHQVYHDGEPSAPYLLIQPDPPPDPDSPSEQEMLRRAGRLMRAAGVRHILLVHGSFVGTDALGWIRKVRRLTPFMGSRLERWQRHWLTRHVGEAGNFTETFAADLQAGLQVDGDGIRVGLADWSGENHHIGRADGAVRCLNALLRCDVQAGERILVWSHSHGGNVMALVTNLLAAPAEVRRRFFRACEPFYKDPVRRRTDLPLWEHVRQVLEHADQDESCRRLRSAHLDVVTFGAPIRYGWDLQGCSHLAHFVNHRPQPDRPPYLAALPRRWEDIFEAVGGDYIHQFGIAGTNWRPSLLSWRAMWSNQRLHQLVQAPIHSRDVVAHWRMGMRVAHDGVTLLVDYGDQGLPFKEQCAGHAVYTRRRWMAFHADRIARRFYANETSVSGEA